MEEQRQQKLAEKAQKAGGTQAQRRAYRAVTRGDADNQEEEKI